jgi:lysozyme
MSRHGIRAVILKATQGAAAQDDTFTKRAREAKTAGLLVGAYHFGERADPDKQLDNFIKAVRGSGATIFAFDFEDWTETLADGTKVPHPAPTVSQAVEFMEGIEKISGRPPLLYGGHSIRETLGGKLNPNVSKFPLWLADYRGTPVLPVGWHQWTFWQYTDGKHGPNAGLTPGVGECDRSVFGGTEEQLSFWWLGTNALIA